ncbi:MAG: 2OG-Fe(II) oxygenase [Acidobacteriaceae bacterium]|nr:2OG-Fe(II) oxygenase [Acidobacteriaceae bacterium]
MQTAVHQVTRSIAYEEFLAVQELRALVAYTMAHQSDFKASQVHDPDHVRDSYRRSRVLMDTDSFHELFRARIAFYLNRILRSLQRPYFDMTRMESQITASNDGDYFRPHNDNTHANWPSREITFVYFFHREPRPFSGGELLLYDFNRDGATDLGPARKRITPRQNSIIFFQSSTLHEILPVHCPTGRFEDSRFTLNGWLHC